jgi:hypothetical protein
MRRVFKILVASPKGRRKRQLRKPLQNRVSLRAAILDEMYGFSDTDTGCYRAWLCLFLQFVIDSSIFHITSLTPIHCFFVETKVVAALNIPAELLNVCQ